MLATAMYCTDNNDVLPSPGWQVSMDNWVTAANPPVMANPHTADHFDRDYRWQVSWFTGNKEPDCPLTPPKPGLLYQDLKNPKVFLCPEDVVDANYLKRYELISSYIWNGAIVAYQNGKSPCKISKLKPTNILQWENDEKNTDAGAWGDFANAPLDGSPLLPTFSKRHGNASQIGRIDGSAGREPYANIIAWAKDSQTPNDLWCNPDSKTGH